MHHDRLKPYISDDIPDWVKRIQKAMLNNSKTPVNSAVSDRQIAGQDNKHVNTKDIIGLSDKSHAKCDPVDTDVKTQVYKTINDNAIC